MLLAKFTMKKELSNFLCRRMRVTVPIVMVLSFAARRAAGAPLFKDIILQNKKKEIRKTWGR